MSSEPQQTLARSASVSGTSLHTGEKVTLKFQPAPVDFGLKFRRKDLPDEPTIDATIANLKTVERATTIGEGSMRVHTVEHVLSALSAMGVDNAIIEMDANEPPIGDGSARPYVELIKKAGIVAQETPRRIFDVREPIHIETKNGSLLVAIAGSDKFRISCTQAGPGGSLHAIPFHGNHPRDLRARNRAGPDVCLLRGRPAADGKKPHQGRQPRERHRRARRSGPEQGTVAFPDEFVRHKILDIIGDLALFGQRIRGHVIAVKPGHGANAELVRALVARMRAHDCPRPATARFPAGRRRPRYQPGHGAPAAPLSVPDGRPRPRFEGETKCIGVKSVTINEPFFQGHFPGHPVMPGVLQVEAMAQVASILMMKLTRAASRVGYFMSADEVKFRKPVFPGDTLFISRGADQDARQQLAKAEVPLRGQRRGRLRRRVDVQLWIK